MLKKNVKQNFEKKCWTKNKENLKNIWRNFEEILKKFDQNYKKKYKKVPWYFSKFALGTPHPPKSIKKYHGTFRKFQKHPRTSWVLLGLCSIKKVPAPPRPPVNKFWKFSLQGYLKIEQDLLYFMQIYGILDLLIL